MKLNSNQRFEIVAEVFRHYTGYLAPGKDESPAMYAGQQHSEDRDKAWSEFIAKYSRTVSDTLNAVEKVC